MRIYTEREGWTEWKFDKRSVNDDVSVFRAWMQKEISTQSAAFWLAENNGWEIRPTNEQFIRMAEQFGYSQWRDPFEDDVG